MVKWCSVTAATDTAIDWGMNGFLLLHCSFGVCACASLILLVFFWFVDESQLGGRLRRRLNLSQQDGDTERTHKMTITEMTEISFRVSSCVRVRTSIVCFLRSEVSFFLPIKTLSTQWFDSDAYLFFFYSFDFSYFFCFSPFPTCTPNSQQPTITKIES